MAGRGFVLSMLLLASLAQAESLWKEYRSTLSEVRPGEVRVVTSQRLDGVTRRYSQVVSGRLHEVSCQARGTGRVQLGVNGSTGWAYSLEAELDPQAWKTLTVSYFETAPAFTISLYTLESNGAVFEAKDATMVVQDAIALPDADVTVAFEAEDYPGSNGQLGEVEGAIGGKAVRGGRHYQLALMPTPVTSRPLYAYCRVRRDADAAVQIAVGRGQQQVLGRADVAPGADWQWVKVGPISAAAMFPQAACRVAGDAQAGLWLDRVVFSTSPDLAAPDAVAAAPVYAQGLVAAGRAKTPPTIDGRGDDACWQETLALGPFVLNKESRPAQEQTTVRLAWDDAYLYAFFHCQESCLIPAANRRHEFRDSVDGPDLETIWNQDCVLLILQPDASQNVCYDLAVSPSGYVTDARMTGPDIWSTRDRSWNAGAKVATVVEDGYWTVEMAIPLSALGGVGKKAWKFRAGRIEKSRSEVSSWNLVEVGFHVLAELADLRLAEVVPGCDGMTLPEFGPGRNAVTYRASQPLHYETRMQYENERCQYTWGMSATSADFTVARTGRFTFQWRLAQPELNEYLLVSPTYALTASSRLLEYDVTGGEVFLNGRPAHSGATLNVGVNRIEIRAAGAVSGTFRCGDYVLPVDDDWVREDRVWRRVLLVDDSRVWPEWRREGVSIARGSIQQFIMVPQGVEGFPLKDYVFYFDLPEGFELVGTSGYYKIWQLETEVVGPVTYGGRPYVRHAVRYLNAIAGNRNRLSWQCAAAVVRAPLAFAEDETQIYFHVGSPSAGICEIPQAIPVRMLPPLDGVQPDRPLLLQMWMGWVHAMTDKTLYPVFAEQLRSMGVNEANFGDGTIVDRLALISLDVWCLNPTAYLEKHPEARKVGLNGKTAAKTVCSTVMTTDQEWMSHLQDTLIPEFLEKYGHPRHVNWDYEAPVTTSELACFCARCLASFQAAFPEIDAEVTSEKIQQQYAPQWTAFMNQRMAAIAGQFRDALHRHQPGIEFSVYTGYHSDFTKRHYGVDWSLLRDKIDRAMCGYGRPVDNLEATREAIGGMPFTLGIIANPYEIEKRTPPTWFRPADLMRRVSDSTGGVLLYHYSTLDSRSFQSVARVSRAMKDYGPYFVAHDVSRRAEVSIPGWSDAEREVLAGADGTLLVVLMNTSRNAKPYEVQLPAGHKAETPLAGKLPAGEFAIIKAVRK